MKTSDKPRFANILKDLAVNSGTRLSAETLELYAKALQEFDIQDIEKAGMAILTTWIYPRIPPIAEILKYLEPRPTLRDRAVMIASAIASTVPSGAKEDFETICGNDPVAKYLMTRRWPYYSWARNLKTAHVHWWEKDFVEAYLAIMKNHKASHLLLPGYDAGAVIREIEFKPKMIENKKSLTS